MSLKITFFAAINGKIAFNEIISSGLPPFGMIIKPMLVEINAQNINKSNKVQQFCHANCVCDFPIKSSFAWLYQSFLYELNLGKKCEYL